MAERARDVWSERREVLEYVLKDFQRRGGRFVLPPSSHGFDAVLLDQLNVTEVLRRIGAGTSQAPIEIGKLTVAATRPIAGAGGAAANPFGISNGGAAAADAANPFASRASPRGAADNPFGHGSAGGGGGDQANPFGGKGGGDASNPFGSSNGGSDLPGKTEGSGGSFWSKKLGFGALGGGSKAHHGHSNSTGALPGGTAGAAAGARRSSKDSHPQSQHGPLTPLQYTMPGGGGSQHDQGRSGAGGEDDVGPPRLDLPQLETGVSDDAVRDWAFVMFSCVVSTPGVIAQQHGGLVEVARAQLGVDESRGQDVARLIKHIEPSWRPEQRASMELITLLLLRARPADFNQDGSGSINTTGSGAVSSGLGATLKGLAGKAAGTPPRPPTGANGTSGGGTGNAAVVTQGAVGGASSGRAFKSFCRWRDAACALLESGLMSAASESWAGEAGTLKPLMARFKGAVRRVSFNNPEDFEELEYAEAVGCLAAAAGELAKRCLSGWSFSWALRLRLAEALQASIFDVLDLGSYVDESALLLQAFDNVVWPALGVSQAAALALSAWAHFSMYVSSREPRLLRNLKNLIVRLSEEAAAAAATTQSRSVSPSPVASPAPHKASDGGGGPGGMSGTVAGGTGGTSVYYPAVPSTDPATTKSASPGALKRSSALPTGGSASSVGCMLEPSDANRDAAMVREVSGRIVSWTHERLCDAYARFPQPASMQGPLDIFVFACRSRGDSGTKLADLLLETVKSSLTMEWHRRTQALLAADTSEESRLLQLRGVAADLLADQAARYTPSLAAYLPAAHAVAAARMHMLFGTHFMPWLSRGPPLDRGTTAVFQAALDFEPLLLDAVQQGCEAGARVQRGEPEQAPPAQPSSSASPFTQPDQGSSNPFGGSNGGASRKPSAAGNAPSATGDRVSGGNRSAGGSWYVDGSKVASEHGLDPAAWKAAWKEVLALLGSVGRWGVEGPLQSAQMQWVAAQVGNMSTWVTRALQQERWKPIGRAQRHSQSSLEVARMCGEALDALFALGLPVGTPPLAALLDGFNSVLLRYAGAVNELLGPMSRLVPPPPPPTRYKKDLVVKQEQAEADAGRATSRTAKKAVFLECTPRIEASPDFVTLTQSLTNEAILTALVSLHFLQTKASSLLESIAQQWSPPPSPPWPDQGLAGTTTTAATTTTAGTTSSNVASPRSPSSSLSAAASPGMPTAARTATSSLPGTPISMDSRMEGCQAALQTGVTYAARFLCTKVVFWDLRLDFLELLYRHHVAKARIDPLLAKLGEVLGAAAGPASGLPDALRPVLVGQLLRAVCQGLERVLLDGGPCRWFTPDDVALIQQDLAKLRVLFVADGDGMRGADADVELSRVHRVLALVKLDSGPLMDLLKQTKARGVATLSPPPGLAAPPEPLSFEEGEVMRALARRPDRTCSKLLKTNYKMSKKIK